MPTRGNNRNEEFNLIAESRKRQGAAAFQIVARPASLHFALALWSAAVLRRFWFTLPMNALILVDLQNDFLPGGALAVPHGDEVIPIANELQERFELVVATQDWHPSDHGSFAANHPGKKPGDRVMLDGIEQILWPVHCVQNTCGAEFAPSFDTSRIDHIFHKGTDPKIDSYSTFFDNAHRRHTGLAHYLEQRSIKDIYLMGLALDYCVKYSALDASHLGLNTHVIIDGCRGIELQPGDVDRALKEMELAGAILLKSSEL